MNNRYRAILALVVIILFAGGAYSATIHIPADQPTIQAGINAAVNGDTVMVAAGEYTESLVFDFEYANILLKSEAGADQTVISKGSTGFATIYFQQGNQNRSTIEGFSLRNPQFEPIVYIGHCNAPAIIGCIFENNRIHYGGALISDGDIVYLTGCIFRNNQVFIKGGPIYISGGQAEITKCSVADNHVSEGGGAVNCINAINVLIDRCTIYNNQTENGTGGTIYLENCINTKIHGNTISDNSLDFAGGGSGIMLSSCENVDIRNNTIAFNNGGTAIFAGGGSFAIEADYNILYGNTDDYYGVLGGSGSIYADPQFVSHLTADYSLQAESPCINNGDPDYIYYDADLTVCDIGAIPFFGSNLPIPVSIRVGRNSYLDLVTDSLPLITWDYFDSTSSNQSHIEVQIGLDMNWDYPEVWNSGAIENSSNTLAYNGPALSDKTVYFMRIKCRNEGGWGVWRYHKFQTSFDNVLLVPAEFATIQSAIDASIPGDSVIVDRGTYDELLVFPAHQLILKSLKGPEVTSLDFMGGHKDNRTDLLNGKTNEMTQEPFTAKGLMSPSANLISVTKPSYSSSIEGFTIKSIYTFEDLILVADAANFTIKDNRFINLHAQFIIRSNEYSKINVISNLFAGSSGGNIIMSPASECSFINNTVDGGDYGIHIYGPNSTILNNIVINIINYAVWQPHPTTLVDYNNFWNNGSENNPGPNGIIENPYFLNPSAINYQLSLFSQCINAGNPEPIYNDPDGSRNDIGAFPFATQSPMQFSLIDLEYLVNGISHRLAPTFSWLPATDPDPGNTLTYNLYIDETQFFTNPLVYDGIPFEEYTLPVPLAFSNEYWWVVEAVDNTGRSTFSDNIGHFKTWRLGDVNNDWRFDILDIIFTIDYKFKNGAAPNPIYTGDVNADCLVNILDIIYMIDAKFKTGPDPLVGCE